MMELLTFINLCEPRGVTLTQIQSHMLTLFGLKFRTTSEMVRELTVSGAVKVDGHGFYHLTDRQQMAFKQVAKEDKQKSINGLLRQIEEIPDDKTRVQAIRLHRKLRELLPRRDSSAEEQ
jgi:Mn-dependent DtxR family transcriptional regulator